MIVTAVPSVVAADELFTDLPDIVLFDVEEAVVANAVDKRRREFGTVRHCARRALEALGHPPLPLVPGERGAPQWPPGVVGSMTHCVGYRAAAVARASDVHTIGIDAEPHAPLPEGILETIARPEENTRLSALRSADASVWWDRLLFSCKESVYKAWYPLTRRWLGFEHASVTLDRVGQTFSAHLLVPGPSVAGQPLRTFAGRWVIRNGLLLTATTVLVQSDRGRIYGI
jgi:4'-phosphopantetheinyl transferase EntD